MAREDKASLDCGQNLCQLHNTITASNQQDRSREKETVLSPYLLDNFKKTSRIYNGQDADQYIVLVKAFIEDASHNAPI